MAQNCDMFFWACAQLLWARGKIVESSCLPLLVAPLCELATELMNLGSCACPVRAGGSLSCKQHTNRIMEYQGPGMPRFHLEFIEVSLIGKSSRVVLCFEPEAQARTVTGRSTRRQNCPPLMGLGASGVGICGGLRQSTWLYIRGQGHFQRP